MKPQLIQQVSFEFARAVEDLVSVKNFRISEIACEFDLFAKDVRSKDQAVETLVLNFGPLLSERNLGEKSSMRSKRETVQLAIELLDQQRYWECHEVLEEIWHVEKDSTEKSVQQGIILVVSALVHAQKNDNDVCLGMFVRAMNMLNEWRRQDYHGLDVGSLKKYVKDTLESGHISFPEIAKVASR
ncbi:MAG: DUF309 domain-containing protein [Nitrososphaerales archaeon]